MSDFITRETVLIKEDPWGKKLKGFACKGAKNPFPTLRVANISIFQGNLSDMWRKLNIFFIFKENGHYNKNGHILPTGQWYAPSAVINNVWRRMVLHGIAWYCMVLHVIAWHCMVLHGIAWHCMVLQGTAWYCMVLHGIAWYCMVLHCIAWYCMVLHDIA